MVEAQTERRLAAIILGDVVGYSRLMGVDEVGTMAALKAHQKDLVLPLLQAARARLVDSAGDAMLMEFGSAVSAVSCAVAIQRGLIARNAEVPEERQLRFRLGINLGDIVVDGDKIYGDGVNVAARLESLCEPDGLCLSGSIHEQVRGRLPYRFEDGGEQSLKNILHPVRVFRLSADFIASLPAPEAAIPRPRPLTSPSVPGPGTVLNDTYQIDALIGAGGMGEIFRGHEIHSGGGVAIKLIRPELMDHKVAASLFQREALVLKDITHDAIVRYYSFSFDPALRRHYLAMEFADGPSLPELLRDGPLEIDDVWALRRRIASGLQVAHELGVVHRDISSDNIIIPRRDVRRAKVIDFGIARADDMGATIIGDGFAGKLRYASPEQLGLMGGQVTPLSDIYSFGLVLAEAALGRPSEMGGSQAEVLDKRRSVPSLAGIDPRLATLIDRMLQPDPAQRPQSMREVMDWPVETGNPATDVATLARPDPKSAAPLRGRDAIKLTNVAPEPRTERWIIASALGIVLLGGATIGAYLWLAPAQRPRPSATAIPTETLSPAASPTTDAVAPTTDKPDTGTPDKTTAIAEPHPQAQPQQAPSPLPEQSGNDTHEIASRIATYVKKYDGGDCFLALPVQVTDTSAAIDSFAANRDMFAAFDTAFTREIGFSPVIVGNRIWSKQCPALDFLRQAGMNDSDAVSLFIRSTEVGRGKTLAGDIQSAARVLALLWVREDGMVVNESQMLKLDGNARTFNLPAPATASSGAVPQMLVAVASARPLDALNLPGPVPASTLFPQILGEARNAGAMLGATAKLFLLTP